MRPPAAMTRVCLYLIVAVFSASAAAQDVTWAHVSHSMWGCSIQKPRTKNETVDGFCVFRGESGTYAMQTRGGAYADGALSDLVYRPSLQAAETAVSGTWSIGKMSGPLNFVVAKDRLSFRGGYRVPGIEGTWRWTGLQLYGFDRFDLVEEGVYRSRFRYRRNDSGGSTEYGRGDLIWGLEPDRAYVHTDDGEWFAVASDGAWSALTDGSWAGFEGVQGPKNAVADCLCLPPMPSGPAGLGTAEDPPPRPPALVGG